MLREYWKCYYSDIYQEPLTINMAKVIPYSHIKVNNEYMISRTYEQELLLAETTDKTNFSIVEHIRGELYVSSCPAAPTSIFKEFSYLEAIRKSNWYNNLINKNYTSGFVIIGDNMKIRETVPKIKSDLIYTDKTMSIERLFSKKFQQYLIDKCLITDIIPYITDWSKINFL